MRRISNFLAQEEDNKFNKVHILIIYATSQNEIQVKIILTWFDSQFPLSSNPNYS